MASACMGLSMVVTHVGVVCDVVCSRRSAVVSCRATSTAPRPSACTTPPTRWPSGGKWQAGRPLHRAELYTLYRRTAWAFEGPHVEPSTSQHSPLPLCLPPPLSGPRCTWWTWARAARWPSSAAARPRPSRPWPSPTTAATWPRPLEGPDSSTSSTARVSEQSGRE